MVLLFFVSAIAFLGQLAYTRNSGQPQLSAINGGIVVRLLPAVLGIAAIIAGIASRQNSR